MLFFLFLFLNNYDDSSSLTIFEPNAIGKNANGTVYKYIYGNESSSDTVVYILGVHNLENGTHDAVNQTLAKMSANLTKRHVVYYTKINYNNLDLNTSDYVTNRHMGEHLTHDYVLKDYKQYKPFLVIDVHENEPGIYPDRYIATLNNTDAPTLEYAHTIGANTDIGVYNYTTGGDSSPKWVTPISKEGIPALLFEYPQIASKTNKTDMATILVNTIDNFVPFRL